MMHFELLYINNCIWGFTLQFAAWIHTFFLLFTWQLQQYDVQFERHKNVYYKQLIFLIYEFLLNRLLI